MILPSQKVSAVRIHAVTIIKDQKGMELISKKIKSL